MIRMTDIPKASDHMGRLISLAVRARINLAVITSVIETSTMAEELQSGRWSRLVNSTAEELFFELFGQTCADMALSFSEYVDYDDAYWCGWAYMQLLFEARVPMPYLFLVLPLGNMLDLYPVYHEMDITQLVDLFEAERSQETIMRRLLKRKKMKAPALSEKSGVSINTINAYRKSDESLYAASFQNAFRLARALDVPPELFLKQLPQLVED